MKNSPTFLKYMVILFLSCSYTNFISSKEIASTDSESSTLLNSLINAISCILFESTKRLTPTDNLTYLIVNAPDIQFKQIQGLIHHGANPNACIGNTEETLIQRAITANKLKMARALIESGAAVTWISKENITAIFQN